MRYNWYYINSFLNKKEVAQLNKTCEVNGILQMQSADTTKTAIVNLSEKPFVGGEFFLWKNKEAEISQLIVPGTLLVFPSFYIHKVNPVIKGTRKTLTFWRCGKPWT